MSWEQPTVLEDGVPVTRRVEAERACPWCGGTGHYACISPFGGLPREPHYQEVEHRAWMGGSFAHRCGRCGGSGERRS